MCGKKPIPERKTILLLAVCKRASLMRAPYRASLQPTAQFIPKNKNASLDKKTKEQPSLIVTSNKENANEKVDANQSSKYLLAINLTHILETSPEIIVNKYFE